MGEVWQAGEAGGEGAGERGRGGALGRARQVGRKEIDHADAKARFALEHGRMRTLQRTAGTLSRETLPLPKRTRD